MRLWGRALSYIKEDQPRHFAWSILTKADFVASQATPAESGGVIDELIKTASGMNFVLLLTEKEGNVHGSLRSTIPSIDVSLIAAVFGGGGHPQAAAFKVLDAQLAQKEPEIIATIREYLDNRDKAQPAAA